MSEQPRDIEEQKPHDAGEDSSRAANGDKKPRNTKRIVATAIVSLFAVLAAFLSMVELWLFDSWDSLSVDEILYHLVTPLDGSNLDVVLVYLTKYLSITIVILVCVFAIMFAFRGRAKAYRACLCVILACSLGGLAWTFADLDKHTSVFTYVRAFVLGNEVDFVADHYVDPEETSITFPSEKKNLIYIYAESLETTFADKESGGAFDYNTIPYLTELAAENEDFRGSGEQLNGGIALPGSQWTAGAMFGQTSGVPLKISLGMSGNAMNDALHFYPELITLGDILADAGYSQTLMVGSNAQFGGRSLYFTEHGNFDICDYGRAQEEGVIPEDYYVFWGFEDEILFGWAQTKLLELAEQEEPFNFTMLTVDTHFEDGYVCSLCGDEFGDNQYANVFACSDRQIASFVAWIQQQDFYEDTVIIITGDHPTMDSDFCQDVPPEYQRKTYTCIINGQASVADPERTREFSTYDLFPTTLAAMGVSIDGDKLGLGTNLYSSKDTLVEQLGFSTCDKNLKMPSEFLMRFSGLLATEETMQLLAESTALVCEVAPWQAPDVHSEFKRQEEITAAVDKLPGAWYYESYEDYAADLYVPGNVKFSADLNVLMTAESITSATLVVMDSRTGDIKRYDMRVAPNPDNPSFARLEQYAEFTEYDVPYLSATLYITVDEFKDYEIASWSAAAS